MISNVTGLAHNDKELSFIAFVFLTALNVLRYLTNACRRTINLRNGAALNVIFEDRGTVSFWGEL